MPTPYIKSSCLAALVGITLVVGCRPTQPNSSSEDIINQIAVEKVGEEFELYPSPDKLYLLFVEKLNPSAATLITRFIVIESASKKIMIEKNFKAGYVKWIGNSVLELFDAPAMVKQNEDLSSYIKRIDIATFKN